MTLLNSIRKANPALQSTWNIHFTETSNEKLLSYVKIAENTEGVKNIIWCVANLDTENTQVGHVTVPRDLLGIYDKINISVQDLLTGETYHWSGEMNYIELNPYKSPIHIFRVGILS